MEHRKISRDEAPDAVAQLIESLGTFGVMLREESQEFPGMAVAEIVDEDQHPVSVLVWFNPPEEDRELITFLTSELQKLSRRMARRAGYDRYASVNPDGNEEEDLTGGIHD